MEQQLQKEEAINKFKELVKDVNICMFTTIDENYNLFSRPMSTLQVDDEGNAWFFTNEFTEKVHEISRDNTVHLIYAHPKNNIYVTVKGTCMVIVDRTKIEELWNPLMKAWFPDGVDDPKLCVLKVITEEAHYWNSSSYKMAVFFSMLQAIANKEKYEAGEVGTLKLN